MGRPRTSARFVAALLALLVLAVSVPATATLPSMAQRENGLKVAIDAMRVLATESHDNAKGRKRLKPKQRKTKPSGARPIKLGKDGRLTVLLAGSDWRPAARGERLDVLMVATIDPQTGDAALVSIPRDMAGIPLAGGANSGGMRVNALYYIRYRDPSLGHAKIDRGAMKRFSKDIGRFLGTEIDYWAMTRFATFSSLVNSLGGIRVDIDEAVLDSSYHHGASRGVWFPKQKDYRLRGDPKCKPKPKKCRSALVYARSRKGTMGAEANNDWRRAERQQDMVRAAVRNVLQDDGAGLALLGRLINVRDKIETNLPKSTEAAGQLYALLHKLRLPKANMKVLAPATWSGLAADGTMRPNLATIRAWVDRHFYKVRD